ncbi:MAG TPA: hypothetical protein VEO95_05510, partial [Chthoniobacteraceae bacterium]|nr:hypothetical protein [Chthoniobacteraceae bacterium]
VEACFSNHPGVCVGYRLFTSAGSIVYLPDNEMECEAAPNESSAETLPRMNGQQLAAFVKDADVLICDSQYTTEEYGEHVGWGHGCLDEVVRFAIAGNVKQLFLYHHDPAHDDAFIEAMLARARSLAAKAGSKLQIEAAREGAEITLAPRIAALR